MGSNFTPAIAGRLGKAMSCAIWSAIFLFLATGAFAQSRTVSGTVTSAEDGSTLPGVNVLVKGTTTGTVTDVDGNYRISVPGNDAILTFSFIGLATQEVQVGSQSTIDVEMTADNEQLEEVVVTAQGIERQKKALGYAVSTVEGKRLEKQPQADVGRILQGKIAGANITSSNGVSGTGTNIIIRGYTSISGSNQPLFIVDGVPFNSALNTDDGQNSFQQAGLGTSSRFLDLDPNNIASVNVLKGLSATVIYGEQGRNGVILITTKNGQGGLTNKKLEVTLDQSVFANNIANLPEYQNSYGGGFHQNFGFFFSNWGPSFDTRGQRGINEDGTTQHPFERLTDPTLRNQFPEYQPGGPLNEYEYRAYDDPGEFFRTGIVSNTSLNIRGASENTTYSTTMSYTRDEGFTPGNTLEKINLGVGGNAYLSNNISINATFNAAITDLETPPISASQGSSAIGAGESIFGDIFYTPRNVDLFGLPFQAPLDNRPVYYRSGNDITNPRWTARNAQNLNDVNRFYGKLGITYEFSDNFNVLYRLGLDTYNELQEFSINRGSATQPEVAPGVLNTINIVNTIWNQDVIFNGDVQINPDLSLQGNLGFNFREDNFRRDGISSVGQVAFGFRNHTNYSANSAVNQLSGIQIQRTEVERILASYGQVTLDYKEYLFLNVAARNDWSSTVEADNRSIFYPSASVSFIPTEAFNIASNDLNFLKVRFGFGQSAGFPDPYNTRNVLISNALSFIENDGTIIARNGNASILSNTDNGATATLGNPNLTPERQQELELGIEGRFLNNRLGLNLTLYNRLTNDLITEVPIDPSTGYTSTFLNLGELENNGVEIEVTGTPVKVGDFQWNLTANFFAYETTVNELGEGLTQVNVAGFSNFGNFAIPGEPFNVILGGAIQRNDEGVPIIGSDGLYQQAPEPQIIGDPNPDFTSSLFSNMTWRGFSFDFQFDYRKGGDIYSTTAETLIGRGVAKETDFDRTQNYIMKGVDAEGNPNQRVITATNLGFSNFIVGPAEQNVYDGTTFRLREVSVGYSLPKTLLENTPFGEVTLTLTGNNLWFEAVNFPETLNFDTDVTSLNAGGNGLGFDFLTGPTSRRFGGTIRLRF